MRFSEIDNVDGRISSIDAFGKSLQVPHSAIPLVNRSDSVNLRERVTVIEPFK